MPAIFNFYLYTGEIRSEEECECLQLEKWSNKSRMRFNTEKCKVLTISRKQNPTKFPYRNCHLVKKKKIWVSPFLMSNNLKWGHHIMKIVAKANKMLGILKRTLLRAWPLKLKLPALRFVSLATKDQCDSVTFI